MPWEDGTSVGLAAKLFQFFINVKMEGATGDGVTNDTAAINSAALAASNAGGGVVWFPHGTYLANGLNLYSNVTYQGVGWGSILKQVAGVADNTYLLSAFGSGTTTASNLVNMGVRDLQMLGRADTDTFTQYVHLLEFSGCSSVRVENVYFNTWRGDAICIASNLNGGSAVERHNEHITIRGCRFYGGAAKNNRNGITVIDGNDILIDDCSFETCTSSSMPGAIDIEPNGNAYHRIRNIKVTNSDFYDVGGAAGVICYNNINSQASLTLPSVGIQIVGNTIRNCTNSLGGVFCQQSQTPTTATERSDILLADNHIEGPDWQPFEIGGIRGMRIERNYFVNHLADCSIGFSFKAMDVVIRGNDFYKCGSSTGRVLAVMNADRFRVERNVFDTNGDGATSGELLRFQIGTGSVGASTAVDMVDNRVVGYASGPTSKAAAHTLSASTNKWENNDTTLAPVAAHFAKTSLVPLGGIFTSTPGAVATVNIAHSLGVTPTMFQVEPGDANARGAPLYFVTATSTNVVLNFASNLTAATAYTWNWAASY